MLPKEKQISYSSEGCFSYLIFKLTNFLPEKLRIMFSFKIAPISENVEDIKN